MSTCLTVARKGSEIKQRKTARWLVRYRVVSRRAAFVSSPVVDGCEPAQWELMAVSFAQGGQVEAALNKLKDHLAANAGSIKRMFQLIDKDLSNQIDVDEFIEVLKACNIVLPPYILKGLVARFDLNGDGYISIPEFTSFMSGDSDRMEMLRDAPGAPAKPATPPPPQQSYGKMPMQQKMRAVTSEGLSRRDFVFVQRMQRDLETRRQTQFINEISTLLLRTCDDTHSLANPAPKCPDSHVPSAA